MNEKFSNAMVTCAAIAVFTGSSAAVVNGASSLIDMKIDASNFKLEQQRLAAEEAAGTVEVVGSLVKGAKKLLR